MRIPLPERAWRRLHWLGIEPPTIGTTADSVEGNLASGSFQGGSGGNVTVNILHPTPIPPPAEAPPESATVVQRIDFMTRALMHIQAAYVEERKERKERQAETDHQFREAQRGRSWIWWGQAVLAIAILILAVFVALLWWQFEIRFGFL